MPYDPKKAEAAKKSEPKGESVTIDLLETSVQTVEIERAGVGLLAQVESAEVVTKEDYAGAADFRKQAKAHIKNVKSTMKDPKSKAKAAHTAICDLEKRLLEPAQEVVKIIDEKMLVWNDEQKRVWLEAQAKAEAEALAEAVRKKAQEIRELVDEGADDEVILEKHREEAEPEEVIVETTKVNGVGATVRKTWKGECTNVDELMFQVLEGKAPRSFFTVNQRELDEYARATKGNKDVPGYRAYQQSSMTGTR